MRRLALLLFLFVATDASAKVINVEFKFSPFTGDPSKSDKVAAVPGRAKVFLNGIPVATQPIQAGELPVLFDEREIAPALWLPAGAVGSMLRKGANTIRIEFEPADPKKKYSAQLRWASVNDTESKTGDAGHGSATNQSGEGVDAKSATGPVVFERAFTADFAADQKWHHYPKVDALGDDDRKQLAALVAKRGDAFRPDFSGVYAALQSNPQIELAEIRKARCVEKAYDVGVRVKAASQLAFVTTGSAAVVIRGSQGDLFAPADPSRFQKVGDEQAQLCAGTALQIAFPSQLVVVRSPSGAWEPLP